MAGGRRRLITGQEDGTEGDGPGEDKSSSREEQPATPASG
jgi:hypothetical protein